MTQDERNRDELETATPSTDDTPEAQSGRAEQDETPGNDLVSETPPEEGDSPAEPEASTENVETDRPQPSASGASGGAGSMIVGGVLAAAIGAAAALVFLPEGWRRGDTAILSERLDSLETRPAGIEMAQVLEALAPLESRIDTLDQRLSTLEGQDGPDLAPLEARITALESTPGGVQEQQLDAAVGALAQRLDRIEAGLDDRTRDAVEAALADARAQIEAQAEQLSAREETVAEAQERIAARAALAELVAAAESGDAAPGALATVTDHLGGVPALAPLADGMPTLAGLQERFAPAARAALASDAPEADAPLGDRLVNFLRSQTGARSLAPREGDGTDAILSRAEATLRAGDLPATLTELDALEGAAAQAMADWRSAADTRLAVLAALDDMQTRLAGNED